MSTIEKDKQSINNLLGRYVQAIYPSREKVEDMFVSGQKLKFYLGIDPTGPHIHIGHATNLLWLKQLQRMGHEVVVLVGDFTAQIGDPTDKTATRKALTKEQVEENMATYLNQVHKILPEGSFKVRYNSEWLAKLNFEDLIKIASRVTVQQMITRDMFQERIKNEKPIYVHEFFYPLMQGYDSVVMEVDGEVGGNDQTFNMLMGRDLEKNLIGKEKIVITTKLLEDAETGKKIMNKSEGNVIALDDSPQEIRRKILSLEDRMTKTIFELCTEKNQEWIDQQAESDPRTFKEKLADELVRMFHGEDALVEADKPIELKLAGKPLDEGLVISGAAPTMSAAHRLIDQGAAEINGKKEVPGGWKRILNKGDALKVGKGKFFEIK